MATITYSGIGTLLTWFTPDSLQAQVENALLSAGWGVTSVKLTNGAAPGISTILFPQTALVPTWGYYIVISIDNSANLNPEVIKQALTTILSNWFSDVTLNVTSAGQGPSLWQTITGNTNPNGGGGGISTNTLLILVAATVVLLTVVNKR